MEEKSTCGGPGGLVICCGVKVLAGVDEGVG